MGYGGVACWGEANTLPSAALQAFADQLAKNARALGGVRAIRDVRVAAFQGQ